MGFLDGFYLVIINRIVYLILLLFQVTSQRFSIGMTPKTLRLPKPGEMLLSVHGSPLGVYKEDNMEAIHGMILVEFVHFLTFKVNILQGLRTLAQLLMPPCGR